ncbi:3-hydroxybutyrate dehydrogenase [Tardiphaga sp. 1201_B9_N1_1]|jgi:3-hydroxybutyrate dehydrogenase|uniref:3-hydroxybutyrate dehydrogenase n=1 Tax=Tardiphaga TaxID=1395974 RepID=UPI000E7116A5|nr:3-hydroxybutyrate dehydrogenase [Tardiphaga robiniae]MDR6658625.1 3-hydroxybutyrate dehydrogenase [Tardiphaga robiniae]NUU40294.1 3-hydroxybutyrate dehydrogenase [Tardiphaga robiniae]
MLSGKSAIITGSTSGIGLGIARGLAASGVNIVLNGFGDANEIEAIRSEIADSHQIRVLYSGANMADGNDIAAMMAQAEQEFGGVDILVNNAGIQYVAPLEEFPVEKWDAIVAINLSSAFHTTRLAIPHMKAKSWGRIVNIASAHALVASPFKSAYVAAKHGIAGLTKTAALEVAEHGITVNAVCPGYVMTPLVEKQIPEQAKARGITEQQVISDVLLAAQPTKRFVTVEELSSVVNFLCTDHARSITGITLPVDGGWTAH